MLLDASRLPWLSTAGGEAKLPLYVQERLRLLTGGKVCPPDGPPRPLRAEAGRVAYEWSVTCPAGDDLTLRSELFTDVAVSHLHFVRVIRDGTRLAERVLNEGDREWNISGELAPSTAGTSLLDYIKLGIEHILTGYDHLLFLLALLLVETALLEVGKVITGFTVGHSLTLALTTLGYVQPEARAVEALIGLSIAIVATEDLWLTGGSPRWFPWCVAAILGLLGAAATRGMGAVPGLTFGGLALFVFCYFSLLRTARAPVRVRWAVAMLFGLIHGFGFASVLAEADMPADRLVRALFGFNLGVEVGQLGAVLLAWPVIVLAIRAGGRAGRLALDFTAATVLALGVFWFATRAYG